MKIVIFRENPSTHDEDYLARQGDGRFCFVRKPTESNLEFDTVREAYDFAAPHTPLQHWRVGWR